MGIYRYTKLSQDLPPIPILQVQLLPPGASRSDGLGCSAILDTGSDCTLMPISLLQRARARVIAQKVKIPVCGVVAAAIPYSVGIAFDRHHVPSTKVFGCPESDIGDMLIIGRDIMNRYRIDFDGPRLEFKIS